MNIMPADPNRRVLVIDDNRAIHDDFRKILAPTTPTVAALDATEGALFGQPANSVQETRFDVDSAYQGQEGMLLVKKALEAGRPYAMAFVDVRMPPGWDGVETTRKLWELDPNLQVVLCTAYSDFSWGEIFEKLGQRDGLLILKKPFDAVEAFQLAHALTEKWGLHQESRRRMEGLERRVTERTHELQQSNHALQTEVGERTRAAEALRESQALYHSLVQQLPAGIFRKDAAGRFVFVNPWYCQLKHMPAEQILGRTALELATAASPESPAMWLTELALQGNEHHEQIMQTGQPIELEETYPGPAGQLQHLQIVKSAVFGPDQKIIGSQGVLFDITELKRAESALVETSALLETLLQNTTDYIYFKDLQSRFVHFSRAMLKLFHLTRPEEMKGRTDFDFFAEDHARPAFTAEQEIIRTGKPVFNLEERETHLDGRVGWALTSKMPWRDKTGQIIGTMGISRDITTRKRMEAQMFESQKLETVGKLAGGVAHEFNSILTAILGQSELLLSDLPAGSPLVKNATEISQAATRAATLTRQLLAYGRKQYLQPEALDLNQVIAGMAGMLHHLLGREVETRIVPAAGLHPVEADAGQIEQVITYLVINAREAMPNGGKLTLETANISLDEEAIRYPEMKPGDYVMLAITDTGTGMTAAVKARAFEPFFTTKDVGQGPGLGLSTCYGIIKQSGGHISVYSEPGRGTTFKIYLPQVVPPAKPRVPRATVPDLPRGTETILLVEDDSSLREVAATLLRRLGYTVLAAANGLEALSLKQQHAGPIDLLFTDLVMPHLSGQELAARVQGLSPHTRILFTSAYTENAMVHQGILDQGAALLQKPFTPSALAHKLREMLDQPGPPKPDPV